MAVGLLQMDSYRRAGRTVKKKKEEKEEEKRKDIERR